MEATRLLDRSFLETRWELFRSLDLHSAYAATAFLVLGRTLGNERTITMILLSQKIGDGPTQRCDARCYDAKHGKCNCICGGRNHGAGKEKALTNVHEMFAPKFLCEHGRFIGYCEKGCTKPKDQGGVEVTRRAVRELRRQAWEHI